MMTGYAQAFQAVTTTDTSGRDMERKRSHHDFRSIKDPSAIDLDRPMNPAEAIRWLGLEDVVKPERLLDLAKRRVIGCLKLPFDGAYLFRRDHLIEFIRQPQYDRQPRPQTRSTRDGSGSLRRPAGRKE